MLYFITVILKLPWKHVAQHTPAVLFSWYRSGHRDLIFFLYGNSTFPRQITWPMWIKSIYRAPTSQKIHLKTHLPIRSVVCWSGGEWGVDKFASREQTTRKKAHIRVSWSTRSRGFRIPRSEIGALVAHLPSLVVPPKCQVECPRCLQ